jgi:DNA-binding Lrp family transcriptional regulator
LAFEERRYAGAVVWLAGRGSMRPPLIGSHLSGERVAWLNAEEASVVLSAYVLIETEVGKVAHVAQALSGLDGVQLAEDLARPYDVIARVRAPGLDQLGRLVISRIQVLDGVTRTLTCMVIQR